MKQDIDTKAEAARIPDAYDYLDIMPPEKWIWEFVRRSERYRRRYKELKKAVEAGESEEKLSVMVDAFIEEVRKDGIMLFSQGLKLLSEDSEDCYLKVPLPMKRYFGSKPFSKSDAEMLDPNAHIPNPDKRFVDFKIHAPLLQGKTFHHTVVYHPEYGITRTSSVPHPIGTEPDFKVYTSLDSLLVDQDGRLGGSSKVPSGTVAEIKMHGRTVNIPLNDEPDPETVTIAVSEEPDPETMYIAVSRKARYEDLKEHLLSEVKEYLHETETKRRYDKWKHYLIVFDLRERYGESISNKEIAEILAEAYPRPRNKRGRRPAYYNSRNIPTYYDEAFVLINWET